MKVTTRPRIWQHPIVLLGPLWQQLEAARKACLCAHAEHCRTITVIDDEGRTVSGSPLNMLTTLQPAMWSAPG